MMIIEIPEFFFWVLITLWAIGLVLDGAKLYYKRKLAKINNEIGPERAEAIAKIAVDQYRKHSR